jgi:glyceraldehyde-3-phosphate dehydrogenase (NADP+)
MEMLIGGTWQAAASGRTEDVTSPFDGTVTGTVPVAGLDDVRAAVDRAEAGAVTWRRTPAYERMRILLRAAELADERAEQTAQIISAEAGKTITEARGEAARSGDLIRLAAFEGTQLYGDALPLDANRGTGLDKIGFTIHQPVGIVVAITPLDPALAGRPYAYGGLKASGIGKEGLRSAVAEMTDIKTVILHGRPW